MQNDHEVPMSDKSKPSLRDCLAYTVLCEYETWLGAPSTSYLSAFLDGATTRARLLGQAVPMWKVYGPLEIPEFYLPLVARTGHPTLSIKWATAMELCHFSLAEGMRELRRAMEAWVQLHGLVTDKLEAGFSDAEDLEVLLKRFARRPGMYLGQQSSWTLRCFLAGMDRGGDWLGLPSLPGLRAIVDGLEERSEKSYGSKFAAYRAYEGSPSELLKWVGIEPE